MPMQKTTDTPNSKIAPVKSSRMAWLLRFIVFIASVAAIVLALNAWRTQRQIQAQCNQQLEQTHQKIHEISQRLATTVQHNIEHKNRMDMLEQRLHEALFQNRQITATTTEEATQAALWFELQTRIHAAYQRAWLSGNSNTLIQALLDAQRRTANQTDPQLGLAHQAIGKDLAVLEHMQLPNHGQLATQLHTILQTLKQLPLLSQQLPKLDANYKAPKKPLQQPQTSWARFKKQLRHGLRQLVRVRTIHTTESALISTEMGLFIREHTRLHIVNARLAVLLGQYTTAHEDVTAAMSLIDRYFNAQSPAVQAIQTHLAQVTKKLQNAERPIIDHTLAALHIPEDPQLTLGN